MSTVLDMHRKVPENEPLLHCEWRREDHTLTQDGSVTVWTLPIEVVSTAQPTQGAQRGSTNGGLQVQLGAFTSNDGAPADPPSPASAPTSTHLSLLLTGFQVFSLPQSYKPGI